MGRGLVGDFQFHAAVDDIGGQAVQFLDLHIAATLTEVLDGNIPESIVFLNEIQNDGLYKWYCETPSYITFDFAEMANGCYGVADRG